MWKCHCGLENDDSSKFCPSCGSRSDFDEELLTPSLDENPSDSETADTDSAEEANPDSVVIVRSSKTWKCSCGEVNPGKAGICRACGKSSYDKSSDMSAPSFSSGGLEPPKTEKIKGGLFAPHPAPSFTPAPAPKAAYIPPSPPPAFVEPTPIDGWTCVCNTINSSDSNFCSSCGSPKPAAEIPEAKPAPEDKPAPAEEPTPVIKPAPEPPKAPEVKIPITTSQGFEGKTVAEYIDVISASDIYYTGGSANSLQFNYSFEQAKKGLMQKAVSLGANALISVQTTVFSPQPTEVVVTVSGTAVKLEGTDGE